MSDNPGFCQAASQPDGGANLDSTTNAKPSRQVWRVCWRDDFRGVAIATPRPQNVTGRSSAIDGAIGCLDVAICAPTSRRGIDGK